MIDTNLFHSEALGKRMTTYSQARSGKPVSVYIENQGAKGFTAYTDGSIVHINKENYLIASQSTEFSKFKTFKAMLDHELAHIIYHDFDEEKKALRTIAKGQMYGTMQPDSSTSQEMIDALQTAIQDPRMALIINKMYGNIENCCIDQHDENSIMKNFPDTAVGILSLRDTMLSEMGAVEQYALISEKYDPENFFKAFYNVLLIYCRTGGFLHYSNDCEDLELVKRFRKMSGHIDQAIRSDDILHQYTEVNYIAAGLWKLVCDTIYRMAEQEGKLVSASEIPEDQNIIFIQPPQENQNQQQNQNSSQGSQNQQNGSQGSQGNSSGNSQEQDDNVSDDGSQSSEQQDSDQKDTSNDSNNGETGENPDDSDQKNNGTDNSGKESSRNEGESDDDKYANDSGADGENKNQEQDKQEADNGSGQPDQDSAQAESPQNSNVHGNDEQSDSGKNNDDKESGQTGQENNKSYPGSRQNDTGLTNSGNSDNKQKTENTNSGSDSMSPGNDQQGISQEDFNEMLNRLINDVDEAGKSNSSESAPLPQNEYSSEEAIKKRNEERNSPESEQSAETENNKTREEAEEVGDEYLQQLIEDIKKHIKEDMAKSEDDSESSKTLRETVREVSKERNEASDYVVNAQIAENKTSDIGRQIESLVKPTSRRLAKAIEEQLRDMKIGYTQKHRQYGRIICVNESYRKDGRFYANKKLPEDIPDMAVAVLVDNSGSMAGEKIEYAIQSAIMLYDFTKELKIPVHIAGHDVNNGMLNYTTYADFNSSANSVERIAAMRPGCCNRDGQALEITARLLSKRPEDIKLLFIISDGLPSAYCGRETGVRDIQTVVKKYERKGIEIFALAIDDDKEEISEIYGKSFINISNLQMLPKTITKIVKSKIMEQI